MSASTHRTPGETYAGYTNLEVTTCARCGVMFAAPEHMLDARRFDGANFYCPSGHSLVFGGARDKLKRELQQEKDRVASLRARRDQLEASLTAQRGAATRARNERDRIAKRASAGVCPCCNRTFKQLARHMASQHPSYPHEAE